jgi:2-oxoglutarate ferredoxin oxidoreductase subunit beta
LTRSIEKALNHKGFSFIEVIAQCPVQYGRRAGLGNAVQMMQSYRDNSVTIQRAKQISEEELHGKIIVGEFCVA